MEAYTPLHTKSIERKILLNPGPATTSKRVKEALIAEDICPREYSFGKVMHKIVDGILAISSANDSHEVALFVASGTGAMEATLCSAIGLNDKVLIITNGAYGKRMEAIANQYQLNHETAFNFGEYPDPREIKKLLKSNNYTHLALIHHETSTGMLNPIEEISNICNEMGVQIIVDAMSSYGAYPLDLSITHIDYIFSSSNKCIHGMAGLSFVVFKKDRIEELKANSKAFYFDLYKQWSNLQQKDQLRFTPPVQICYAFLEAINETLEEGVEARWKRYNNNWMILRDGLSNLGFTFFLEENQQSKILLAIDLDSRPGLDFNHFHNYLYENGITIYPGVIPEINTFRVSVIGDLYPVDMHYVITKMSDYFS